MTEEIEKQAFQTDEQIRLGDQIQRADETRFEYAARMESMGHLYETSRPHWRKRDSEQANAKLDAAVARVNDLQTPTLLYSFGFDAEQLLTIYNALRTYLRANIQQDNEDLETIERIASMLIEIKPRAVEASKHLSLKAVGMEAK